MPVGHAEGGARKPLEVRVRGLSRAEMRWGIPVGHTTHAGPALEHTGVGRAAALSRKLPHGAS